MRTLGIALVIDVAVQVAFATWRWHVWSFGTDTGTFAQAIADTFGGFRDGPEQGTHFRFHWAPLLATLWPLVALARTPLALQIAQIVLIAASAVPLYALARTYAGDARAGGYATLALVYPPLGAVAFTEFHEIAFYPVLALATMWAADRARWAWFALFAILGALVREEACIVWMFVGLALAAIALVRRRATVRDGAPGLLAGAPLEPERLAVAGLSLALVNAGALAMYYGVVIPRVGPWQPSRFYEYAFAHGPVQLVVALATHPANVVPLLTLGRLTYLLEAFVPLAFLPLRSRWTWLAVPGLLVVLLSSDPIAWRMGSHYAAIWCPWFLLGAVAALARVDRPERPFRAALALCAVVLIAFNPTHVAHYIRPPYAHLDDARRALAVVPPGAALATHDEWFAQIALADRAAGPFLCPYDAFAVYADDFPNAYAREAIEPELRAEVARGEAAVVARFGSVVVYRRTPHPGARPGDCITPGDVRFHSLRESLSRP